MIMLTRTFRRAYATQSSRSDDYQVVGLLGKGSTSRVFQAYNVVNNNQVVLKLFKNVTPPEKIKREIRINQIIQQCQYVLPLLDVIQEEQCGGYGMVFKYFPGTTFNYRIDGLGFRKGLSYCRDILMAIDYCHDRGVIHRDIKSSNVLITQEGAKLFDFGLSRLESDGDMVTKRFGTKCYHSPEVIFRMPVYTSKVDIWTFGVMMAQVLAQKKPLLPYISDEDFARQIVSFSGYDEQIVKNPSLKSMPRINFHRLLKNKAEASLTEPIADLLQAMTNINPNNRPSAKQILSHDIFQNSTL